MNQSLVICIFVRLRIPQPQASLSDKKKAAFFFFFPTGITCAWQTSAGRKAVEAEYLIFIRRLTPRRAGVWPRSTTKVPWLRWVFT